MDAKLLLEAAGALMLAAAAWQSWSAVKAVRAMRPGRAKAAATFQCRTDAHVYNPATGDTVAAGLVFGETDDNSPSIYFRSKTRGDGALLCVMVAEITLRVPGHDTALASMKAGASDRQELRRILLRGLPVVMECWSTDNKRFFTHDIGSGRGLIKRLRTWLEFRQACDFMSAIREDKARRAKRNKGKKPQTLAESFASLPPRERLAGLDAPNPDIEDMKPFSERRQPKQVRAKPTAVWDNLDIKSGEFGHLEE